MTGFIVLAVVTFGLYCFVKWYRRYVVPYLIRTARKKRDRQIETALRYRMYDMQAARRIGRRMLDDDEF
ncbi:hypothetical protein G3I60_20170 [Streptomyces sp. SID13666]|uniref:hypothetical protein n=1 Tax=Streptomyces sp. SID13666 TaxID=2706054 RepID=UPI0013C01AA7|nr:hypothetical protein [Streptomyces sp. SID13666]NEA56398.1 hypothetical protein [Streptomyces sp. SID13666]